MRLFLNFLLIITVTFSAHASEPQDDSTPTMRTKRRACTEDSFNKENAPAPKVRYNYPRNPKGGDNFLPLPEELQNDETSCFPPLRADCAPYLYAGMTRSERKILKERHPNFIFSPKAPKPQGRFVASVPLHADHFLVNPRVQGLTRRSVRFMTEQQREHLNTASALSAVLTYYQECRNKGERPDINATLLRFEEAKPFYDLQIKVGSEVFCINRYQIDMDALDARGRTNQERMAQGLNPILLQGEKGHYHHLTQGRSDLEYIILLPESFHHENDALLHQFLGEMQSQVRPGGDGLSFGRKRLFVNQTIANQNDDQD